MLYNLTPAKELTGGPWYTELEFDHEFISELRTFLMHCVRRLNGGRGVTLAEIKEKMLQANVSRVQLSLEEVQQLMQTLAFDHQIDNSDVNEEGETLFVAARRVTPMCEFKCKKPGFFVYLYANFSRMYALLWMFRRVGRTFSRFSLSHHSI